MGLWTKKNLESSTVAYENPQFKRVLGPFNLILMGIGIVVGAGLFTLTGIAAAQNAGPAIVYSFILGAIGCGFAGLCYCELAAMMPNSGSAYSYAYVAMGQLVAWMIGWVLILEYAIGASAVSVSWSGYLVSLLNDLDIHLPEILVASYWQPLPLPEGGHIYGLVNIPAFLIVSLISLLLMLGVRESSFVNAVIVFIKISVIIVFISIGMFYIKMENYHPFIPKNTGVFGEYGISGIFRGAGVVFFAYVGFDAVSTAAQETRNPQKSIPIGLLGSLAICTIIYIVFSFVMTGLVNYKALNVAAPVALAIDQTPFTWLQFLIKIGVLAGLTSVMLGLLYGQSRIFYIMSKDGLLPDFFAKLHPAWKTPWRSNQFLLVLTGTLGAFAPISSLGHMTSIGTLMAFIVVCLSVIILRRTHADVHRPFKVPFFPWVPLAGIAVCLALMFSLETVIWFRLAIWMSLGLLIYFVYGYEAAKTSNPN